MITVKTLKKTMLALLGLYAATAALFYVIAGPQLYYKNEVSPMEKPAVPIGEITDGKTLSQRFTSSMDVISGITLPLSLYGGHKSGSLIVRIFDDGTLAAETAVNATSTATGKNTEAAFIPPIENARGKTFVLALSSAKSEKDGAITAYYGLPASGKENAFFNGVPLGGPLSFSIKGASRLWLGDHYWRAAGVLGLLLVFYGYYTVYRFKKGKKNFPVRIFCVYQRYRFLMSQLIARDFKTKYKRSVLGIFWSFLNPLLMMVVQYVVFVNLFRFNIDNYAVYLLSGIVFFNFFADAANQAMGSIVGNASLITKVYVPKYIYPVSKVFSSAINLLLAVLPLIIVMIATGVRFTWALLLLPYGIVCLVAFSIGVGLVLSSVMVFFRDTQFLWGVIVMMWMYFTPIFYPISILPPFLQKAMGFNPMSHFIEFNRTILLEGVSPEPQAYAFCLCFSLAALLIGAAVFKRTQDRFVLNI